MGLQGMCDSNQYIFTLFHRKSCRDLVHNQPCIAFDMPGPTEGLPSAEECYDAVATSCCCTAKQHGLCKYRKVFDHDGGHLCCRAVAGSCPFFSSYEKRDRHLA